MREKDLEYIKKYLPTEELEQGINLLKEGVSPQYIVGNVNFYGNDLKVDKRVLIPRFETELLVEKTISYIEKIFSKKIKDLRILDIGTGSGCIAITLQKELGSKVVAVDVSKDAIAVAKENAFLNQVEVSFLVSDLFECVEGNFDVVISNPPYIMLDEKIEEIVQRNEPHLALYAKDEGLYFYKKILRDISDYLKSTFLIAFEIGQHQGEMVKNLAYQYLKGIEVMIEKDYSNRDRFVFIYRR